MSLEQAQAAQSAASANSAEVQASPSAKPVQTLAGYIDDIFERNKRYRQKVGIDDEIAMSLRQCIGEYEPNDEQKIKESGSPVIFIRLTDAKRLAAIAWILDILANASEKPWKIGPSPIPDLPPSDVQRIVLQTMQAWLDNARMTGVVYPPEVVRQYAGELRDRSLKAITDEANKRALRMDRKIHDQQVEGGWFDAFIEYVDNLVTFGTAFMRGPIVRVRPALKWVKDANGWKPDETSTVRFEHEAPAPIDVFPSPGMRVIESGDVIIRVRYTPAALRAMRTIKAYNSDAIDAVLAQFRDGFRQEERIDIDATMDQLSKRGDESDTKDLIEGLEFWGEVSGELLIGRGISRDNKDKPVEPDGWYSVNAIKIGENHIYTQLDSVGVDRQLSKSVLYSEPGAFWGGSLAKKMRDIQRMANTAIRSLAVNLPMSSGPQAFMPDAGRLHPMDDRKMRPWKVWLFNNAMNSSNAPLHFFNVDSHSTELLNIYDRFARMADEITGIPAFAYGNDAVAGAGRTASGLSMLIGGASRGIKQIVMHIDKTAIRPSVTRQYNLNMLFDEDETIKGDVVVEARGILSLLMQEQVATKRMAFANQTANPIDSQIIDLQRRARLLRSAAAPLDIPVDDIIPTDEEMEQKVARLEQMAAEQQKMQQQIEMAKARGQSAQQGPEGSGAGQLPPSVAGMSPSVPEKRSFTPRPVQPPQEGE